MKSRPIPVAVLVAIALTALLSLFSIYRRYQVETENRSLAVAAEYETIEGLGAAQAQTIGAALASMRLQGLNAVVLSEETVGEMIGQGRVSITTQTAPDGGQPISALEFTDLSCAPRIQRGLRIRFHDLAGRLTLRGNTMVLPAISSLLVRTTPIGISPTQAANAAAAKMLIVVRCSNPSGVSAESVRETLAWAKELGGSVFLPQGDQVLGRRDAIGATQEALATLGMRYASPEFAKIGGDSEMVENAPDNVIRLHAAQTAELDRLTPIDAVDRYAKAARERNMRILLIRPLSPAAPEPLGAFSTFVHDIVRQTMADGAVLGEPHPYREPNLPRPIFLLLGLAIAPVAWFAVAAFVTNARIRLVGAVLIGLLGLACWVHTGQQIMAILGSMAFPIVGFFVLDSLLPRLRGSETGRIVIGFVVVSAISLVGGLCVAGMLNGLPFYVKASEFKAVKLSVFFPIVVIGVHYFLSLTDWRGSMRSPITWGASALGLVIAIGLALMLARTGNDSGIGASGSEMMVRNVLDRFLYVRPRTKEFMIGHPLLFLGIGMLLRLHARAPREEGDTTRAAMTGWTVLILMLGAIGQTSIVNTLSHLHIPVTLSLARIGEGLALGCIIGVGAWAVLGRLRPVGEA